MTGKDNKNSAMDIFAKFQDLVVFPFMFFLAVGQLRDISLKSVATLWLFSTFSSQAKLTTLPT